MPPFEILTFDCYGTLIDWQKGMRDALVGLMKGKGLSLDADVILRSYGEAERSLEQGRYRRYRDVLRLGVEKAFREEGVKLTRAEASVFSDTLPSWPKFPDTSETLAKLKKKGYKLVILSNIDDDLVQGSIKVMGIDFDGVITAQQVGSYKPAHGHWKRMLQTFRAPKAKVLHVAQSYYHDVVSGKEQGYTVAWINRYGGPLPGPVRPDYQFPDLKGLLTIL